MPTQILMTRLRSYERARDWLREARDVELKPGRSVRVVNERYNGYGMIVSDESCPLDKIAVQLENGNKWWYPVEDCSVTNRETCPPWLQQLIKAESKATMRRLGTRKNSEVQP